MTLPALTLTELRPGSPDAALLVVGPSLGTAVVPLWAACADVLGGDVRVVGWDLPGHGSSPPAHAPFTIADLAEAVVRETTAVRSEARGDVFYAGVSLGGAVGLQLALDHPATVAAVAVICSGAQIGEPAAWHERANLVRRDGTPVMVEASAQRWFAPGSIERDPKCATALLTSLQHADRFDYARCCEALAAFDVGARLAEVPVPVLAVAGEHDAVTPTASARAVAEGTGGELAVIAGAAHLAPAEQPADVAARLTRFFARTNAGDAGPEETTR